MLRAHLNEHKGITQAYNTQIQGPFQRTPKGIIIIVITDTRMWHLEKTEITLKGLKFKVFVYNKFWMKKAEII